MSESKVKDKTKERGGGKGKGRGKGKESPDGINAVWAHLKKGLDKIFASSETLSEDKEKAAIEPQEWMEMYTLIVRYCTSTQSLCSRRDLSVRTSVDGLVDNPHAELPGGELYSRLEDYIQKRVFRITTKFVVVTDPEIFISNIGSEWVKYRKAILATDRLFSYLVHARTHT